MYFANPWGLLGLLSLPVIAAIHLYQRRFPPLLVAGAHLWGAETRVQTAGRRRDRLPITPSLLLELLAALIFSLALAQPRFGEMGSVAHLVTVLDNSASMSAGPAEGPGVREQAIATIADRMDDLGRDARVTLIRSGLQPTLLGRQAMLWEEAQAVLQDWQPQDARHDFGPSWDEAARIVGDEGEFLFITDKIDQQRETLPLGMDVVSVGRKMNNVAISTARWTYDAEAGEGRLFLRISNYGNVSTSATVTAAAGDQQIFQQGFALDPMTAAPLELAVPGGVGQLAVSVAAPGDGLDVDNHVTLIEPKIRLLTVAVTLPADSEEQRLTRRVLSAVPDVQLGSPETAHLLIGPAGELPASRSDLWWFGIGPINPSPLIARQAKDLLGPFLIEKQHPLMEGLVLGGVVWGGVQPTDLALRPLISTGNTTLLGQLIETPMAAYVMNIDLARSNLGESPDWPILITNLLERRRDELPGLRLWNFHLNETVSFRAPPVDEPAESASAPDEDWRTLLLVDAQGNERRLIRDRNDFVEISRLQETGVYRIRDGEETIGEFAVNFLDADESASLGDRAPGERQSKAEVSATRLSIDDPYSWLMVLAILLLLGTVMSDWYVLRPRGQV